MLWIHHALAIDLGKMTSKYSEKYIVAPCFYKSYSVHLVFKNIGPYINKFFTFGALSG